MYDAAATALWNRNGNGHPYSWQHGDIDREAMRMSWQTWLSYAKASAGIAHGSRAFGGPVQATLSLTRRCNIRCVHCYYFSPHLSLYDMTQGAQGRRVDADYGMTTGLIEELLSMGTRAFLFTGKGEPFMHGNILDFAGLIKRRGGHCIANTNATLLGPEMSAELLRLQFDVLRVNAMAGTEEMYQRTHPGVAVGTFDALKENLRALKREKVRLKVDKPEVVHVLIVTTENCEDLSDFAEFASFTQADHVIFRPVDDRGDTGLAKTVPTVEQSSRIREQLLKIGPFLTSRGIKHNIGNFLKVFRGKLDTAALYRIIPCYYGWLNVRIDESGTVYPCNRSGKRPIGNIYEKEFGEIWNSEAYCGFRREAVEINSRKSPVKGCGCNACVHHTANLRAYRLLHPLKGRSRMIDQICPSGS